MRKLIVLCALVASSLLFAGCSGGAAEEAVSDKPVGDTKPTETGGPKAGAGGGAGAPVAAPEPTPGPGTGAAPGK